MSGSISTMTVHTCYRQTKPARDVSVGCLRTHWLWERSPLGEILAVCKATTQLLDAGQAPAKVVFFTNSQATILALSNNTPTNCFNTVQCRTKIVMLISYGWTVAEQWIPSHVRISGNEGADQKTKQGAESSQPDVPLTLRRAKSLISTNLD
ncbi:reverse transcriptase [Trichonephila clavipes]|nr:reverse transcriptase [Trichonephila clavipes]